MAASGTPQVSPGEHACCVFRSDDDQAQLVGRFARDAVARRDRIFYLADRSDEASVAAFLDDAGIDGQALLGSGALQVMHSSQLDLEDGFDRKRQLAAWRQLTAAARDDGYSGLAVLAEMSWALSRNVDLDALIEYEATAAPVFAGGELSAVCQYDARLFDGATLSRAGHAHPYAIALSDDGVAVDYNRLLLRRGRQLELAGEIDLANLHFLDQQLTELLDGGDVVADCAGVTFIDAGGCRLLHAARNGAHGTGRLVLRNTPEIVERVMQVFDRLEEPI
jgi:anti-anti-sigma factor